MRLRNIPGAKEHLAASPCVIGNPEEWKGKWSERFGSPNPVRLEIGTGKGRFLLQLAQENPDVNYIGIEKYSSVLLRAVQKQEEAELPNILFLRYEAELLGNVFAPGEIDRIYLNFSDPWPKKSQAGRRLPCKEFLRLYDRFLRPGGVIEFKTDNRGLFDFALGEIGPGGFQLEALSFDLHHDKVLGKGNIMTEYEERFSAKGNPICKYIISRKVRES
ncbi:tRNA (guanosine(46)-N7)-methyltransferase TrmB [Lachnoclostridium sp. Marseille-P6806]|uniref:tRNA (guanosine(46)-N7)-methyltransferase TrmB n=1 Tax=Lachnoclostridium sp. Marseille-P6806 TaxID=2364793 RepID=UPI0010316D98|nr:tRNA (guanosine(46)-N7)-methyltransferase TrmB [Lachnoclostridium sp. Marseille-P6806]